MSRFVYHVFDRSKAIDAGYDIVAKSKAGKEYPVKVISYTSECKTDNHKRPIVTEIYLEDGDVIIRTFPLNGVNSDYQLFLKEEVRDQLYTLEVSHYSEFTECDSELWYKEAYHNRTFNQIKDIIKTHTDGYIYDTPEEQLTAPHLFSIKDYAFCIKKEL